MCLPDASTFFTRDAFLAKGDQARSIQLWYTNAVQDKSYWKGVFFLLWAMCVAVEVYRGCKIA